MRSFLPHRDRLLWAALGLCALLVMAVALLCFVFVAIEAVPALRGHGTNLLSMRWYPSEGELGLLPMLVGSLLVTIGAALVAVPAGIGIAAFSLFIAPRPVAWLCRHTLLLGACLPSVVYGLWGLDRLVPLVARISGPGASLLAGIVVLALMVVPTVALFAHGVLASFPRSELRAATALSLSPFSIAFQVAIPPRRRGLALAGLLGFGRAIGETMAVLMVTGNVSRVPATVFEPIRSLTANIALEMGYAEGLHRSALFAGGLLLACAVLILAILQQRMGAADA
jgi:phosphate transport system permease protein